MLLDALQNRPTLVCIPVREAVCEVDGILVVGEGEGEGEGVGVGILLVLVQGVTPAHSMQLIETEDSARAPFSSCAHVSSEYPQTVLCIKLTPPM